MQAISNKTLTVIILACLFVTVLSTWIVLEKLNEFKPISDGTSQSSSSGKLSFSIVSPNDSASSSAGQVSLNIVDG